MHILLIILCIIMILIILLSTKKQNLSLVNKGSAESRLPELTSTAGIQTPFVYISKGKLFLWGQSGQVEQVQSPYVQEMVDRMERRQQMHGWKQNTSLATSFTGQNTIPTGDQIEIQVISAEFVPDNKLIYFMRDSHVGGLFEYDITNNTERRLIHKQNLSFEDLKVDASGKHILASQVNANGIANIVKISDEGDSCTQLTEGDTVDQAPVWIPEDYNNILYQSAGLARGEEGYVVAVGPASIKMLDIKTNKLTTVLEHPEVDYIQPRVDSRGNL